MDLALDLALTVHAALNMDTVDMEMHIVVI